MKNYFLITGMDNGHPIKEYIVSTSNGELPFVITNYNESGDSTRYYERISKNKAMELKEKGTYMED